MELWPRYSDDRLLCYLTLHERRYIIDHTTSLTLPPGEVLIHQGDSDDTMYLVESGKLEVIDERLGSDVVINTLGVGEVLGEMAFLCQTPRSATVRAKEESAVRAFGAMNLQLIANEAPEILGKISLAISEILSARLFDLLQKLPELTDQRRATEAGLLV